MHIIHGLLNKKENIIICCLLLLVIELLPRVSKACQPAGAWCAKYARGLGFGWVL